MWHKQPERKGSSPPAEPSAPASSNAPAGPEPPRELGGGVSHISEGLRVKGELLGRQDLDMNGQFEGNIRLTDATVTVGPQGRVSGDVEAREIVVQGSVWGNLRGRERVRIDATGALQGDVATQHLAVKEGAVIRGKVDMGGGKDSPPRSKNTANAGTELPPSVSVHAKDASN